jgi:hypothetical protein
MPGTQTTADEVAQVQDEGLPSPREALEEFEFEPTIVRGRE